MHVHGETVTFKPGDPVQQLVFPVQVALGRLLGKYEKYADAPEPVRPE